MLDITVLEFPNRIPFVVVRKLGDDRTGESSQVARSRIVIFVRQTGGISEAARMHAEGAGILIHYFGEYRLGTRDMFCQCDACVVAGLHNHAKQKILHADARANFDEHARSGRAPGLFAHGYLIIQSHLLFPQRAENSISRH